MSDTRIVGLRMLLLATAVMPIAMAGCSGTIPSHYTPSNYVKVSGRAGIGDFTYRAELEGKAAPNQLENTAAGTVYISENVVDLVRRATALELDRSGVDRDPGAGIVVGGDVLEFKLDDLGYSVDWYYTIRYRIHEEGNPVPLFQREYTVPKKTTGKFGQPSAYTDSVNAMVREAYEAFAADPEAQAILRRDLSGDPGRPVM